MLLSFILPTEGSDLLNLCRVYSTLTAIAMISGHPAISAGISALTVYMLHHNAFRASSQKDGGEALDTWRLLCSISVLASFGSWALLFLSSLKTDEAQAYQTHFFGYAIQKMWAFGLAYILVQDLRLTVSESAEGGGSSSTTATNKRPKLQRKSSLEMVFYECRIRIIAGRDLVAKDTNLFGRKTTSDPYVIIQHGPNQIGRTPIVHKTLDPVWPPYVLRMAVLPKSLEIYKEIKCFIYDHDTMSADDAMGTVYVPIPPQFDTKYSKWFKVHKGSGENFCHDATGQLLVEIEVVTK